MPASQARAVIEEELGGLPLEEVFEWIDLDEPLGSASIAQVLLRSRTLPVMPYKHTETLPLVNDHKGQLDRQCVLCEAVGSLAGSRG